MTIICSVRNCKVEWSNDAAGKVAFCAHLVNAHKFPILHSGSGDVVEEVTKDDEHKLLELLPFIPTTVAPMGDVEIQRAEPSSQNFFVGFDYDRLRYKATRTSTKTRANLQTSQVPQAVKSQRNQSKYQKRVSGKSDEERQKFYAEATKRAKAYAAKNKDEVLQKNRERYRAKQASMSEEERADYRQRKAGVQREARARKRKEREGDALSSRNTLDKQ